MSTPRRFKVSKKLLSGTYNLVHEATAQDQSDYSVDVKPRTNAKLPFMVLFDNSKRVIGNVARPANSPQFNISLTGSEEGDRVNPMQRTGDKEAAWSATAPGGISKQVVWKGTSRVVDGYKLFGKAGESDTVLAEFTSSKGMSKGGVLQINTDWGTEFERMVIMTFMCMFDKVSARATNASGWGSGVGPRP